VLCIVTASSTRHGLQVVTQLASLTVADGQSPRAPASINLSASQLTTRDLQLLFAALSTAAGDGALPPLQLDLSQSPFRDADGVKALTGWLRAFPIAHLLVAGCGLTDAQLEAVVHALHAAGTAETLDISSNGAGLATCTALATWLRSPACRLTRLSLDNNRIADAGAIVLATDGLAAARSLRALCLRRCGIGQRGGVALRRCLESNASLLHVHVEYNTVQSALCAALDAALAVNRKVRMGGGGGG